MSMISASVGFCPRDRITVPSSLVVIVPEEGLEEDTLEPGLRKVRIAFLFKNHIYACNSFKA